MCDDDEPEFDFMADRLGLKIASYNSKVDQQIYNVAKMIIEARANDTTAYNTEIAKALGMTPEHVELIQYILGAVIYPHEKGEEYWQRSPFTYGTSPRGLFVDNPNKAERFMDEFDAYMRKWDD